MKGRGERARERERIDGKTRDRIKREVDRKRVVGKRSVRMTAWREERRKKEVKEDEEKIKETKERKESGERKGKISNSESIGRGCEERKKGEV